MALCEANQPSRPQKEKAVGSWSSSKPMAASNGRQSATVAVGDPGFAASRRRR